MNPLDSPGHLPFRPDLQGLRAIAITLVVFAHAGVPGLSGGFVGVDMFFVLSGYLISGLLVREFERNGRIAFLQFYARRLKRLLPALILMLGVMTGTAFWLLSVVEAKAQLSSAGFAATWSSNLYFTFTALDYFNELAARDIFLHTWSLAVEEQFYLVWPLLLLAAMLIHRLNWMGNGKQARFLWLGLIFLASLGLSVYWTIKSPQAAFYLMPSRIWQFTLGALVYLAFHKPFNGESEESRFSFGPQVAWIALSSGLLLVIGSAFCLHPNLAYPGLWALAPSLGAALLIMAGYGLSKGYADPLAHPVLVWVGDRSYSWYLWHWPILILGFSLGLQGQFWPTVCLVLLSVLAASLSYRYIELPFWKGRFSRVKPARVILFAILMMAAAVAIFYQLLRSPPDGENNADPSMQWRTDIPVIYPMHCDAWYHHARVEACTFGRDNPMKTVVMLGDSIGAQWFSLVPGIFPEPDWLTVVLTKSSCPMVDEDFFYQRIGKVYEICREWREAVLTLLEQRKPDVIIVGSAATYDFSEKQWVEGSRRVFERLSRAAGSVIVLPGTPTLGFDGPGCVARHLSSSQQIFPVEACLSLNRLEQSEAVTDYLSRAASGFANVHIVDLNDLVCPNRVCQARNQYGVVVFRDSQHLTDSFVRSVIPSVQQRFVSLGVQP